MKACLDARDLAALLPCLVLSLLPLCAGFERKPMYDCKVMQGMFPGSWPKTFESQIYWFGLNDTSERATGNASRFYDPNKKTIVFIDGFNGLYHVSTCHRMTSKCVPLSRCEEGSQYIADPWVKTGWNFGIFFWDQIADEDCYYTAEEKVWGLRNLTWKSYDSASGDVSTHPYPGAETSVGQLCASAMRSALPTFNGPSLRLTGFSLGAQVAAACAEQLYLQTPNHPAAPTLLSLLEPTFSSVIKAWSAAPFHACNPHLGDFKVTVNHTVQAVNRLWSHGVPMALYKSSFMTRCCHVSDLVFDPGTELDMLGTHIRWTPRFCGSDFNYPCQHGIIVPFYFFNLGFIQANQTALGSPAPSAGSCVVPGPECSDQEIKLLVTQQRAATDGKQHFWNQVAGMETWTVSDDVFQWEVIHEPTMLPPLQTPPPALLEDAAAQRLFTAKRRIRVGVSGSSGLASVAFAGLVFLAYLGLRAMRRHYLGALALEQQTELLE